MSLLALLSLLGCTSQESGVLSQGFGRDVHGDVALHVVDSAQQSWYFTGHLGELPALYAAFMVGFPFEGLRQHISCQVKSGNTNKRISHNCDTVGGHSGGPVYGLFAGGGTSTRVIVAVHAGSGLPNHRGARVAYWISGMLSAMAGLVAWTEEAL